MGCNLHLNFYGGTMKKIYKYELRTDSINLQFVTMPVNAKILHTGVRDGAFVLWAEVEPAEKLLQIYHLCIVPTGEIVPEGYNYINTILDEPFVWHVYVRG